MLKSIITIELNFCRTFSSSDFTEKVLQHFQSVKIVAVIQRFAINQENQHDSFYKIILEEGVGF